MRITALALFGALGLAASIASANAAPLAPATPEASNIVQVAGGCGSGFHRNTHGFCVRYRHHRPYAYRSHRAYRSYGYYGGGDNSWYGPSPNDWVANQLNAQELGRLHYGY